MYAAALFGPSYDTSNGHDLEHLEMFDTVGQAIEAMFDRHRAHGRQSFNITNANGYNMALMFPAFGAGTALQLFDVGFLRPHTESRKLELLDRVAAGLWDWYLILEHNGSDIYVRTHRA